MSMNKKTSIIIVSYNTGPVLARCLDSTLNQDSVHEIILVDNGNPDDMRARLQEFAKQNNKIRIISGQGNVGFATGCNIGVKEATGDYILILNPDSILPKNAVVDIISEMEKKPEAWLAGCQMIQPDGSPQGGSKRNLLTPKIAFSQALRLYKLGMQPMNIAEINGEESSFVPAISGAFMMIPKDKYEKIGGMDEKYFFHVEDLDLCWNINKMGGKILYVPKIKIIHYRSSSRVSSFFIEKNKTDGFIRYFNKHGDELCPGVLLYFIILGIYMRLVFRMIPMLASRLIENRRISARDIIKKRQLNMLSLPVENEVNKEDFTNIEPVLLAGATGQVGLAILRRLLSLNIKTYAIYNRDIVDFRNKNLNWVHGDLNRKNFLDLEDIKAKTFIQTPAIWLLPQHIDKLAKSGIKKIICFSSTSIMGKATSQNDYEKDLIGKFVAAEHDVAKKCKEHGITWTIFRPTMIYGFGLDKNVSSIVRFAEKTGFFPITTPGKGLRQPVHADDLADAVVSALTNKDMEGKTYNLGGGERVSYRDMVARIFSFMSNYPRIINIKFLPQILDTISLVIGKKDINGEIAKRMNSDLVFDDSPARKDFLYNPRKFLSAGKMDLGMEG